MVSVPPLSRVRGSIAPGPLRLQGIPIHFSPAPPPHPRLRRQATHAPHRHPHPARAFMRDTRIPRRQPPPRPRLRRQATHAPHRHPHPARAFVGIPMRFCRRPPPHPRLRRSSPAPTGERGPCVAISGEQPYPGWSRREIVSGVELVGNRIRLFPTYPLALDRGDIATGGEADGEGELVPPPLSPTLQPSYFSPPPHPARASGAPPPPPPGGRGPCVAISGEQPCPGWSRWAAVPGSSPGSPHALDRVDIATGGRGRRGGGTRSPSPVSHTPTILLLAGVPCPRLLPVKHTLSAGPPAPPIPG